MKKFTMCFLLLGGMQLSGCTVIGMIADNRVNERLDNDRPLMSTASEHEPYTEFGAMGLETDIKIVKKLVDTLTPARSEPQKRCEIINNRRICYQQGSERY
ncbi:MAG: hypothetical protein KKE30_04535 [Gammaproteobacteria bacterium]|nr:hypothetical protein [Gammaproteobacteria bacterium]MBU1554305.1 hypothetical protein [Gammaproteobacteria bacterium]MBU2070045.1 hypothetical protein [Gammaproteobacteria bacterium]MBU2183659.1 hypothetical protein [Gammaproteobacteria bacterium]MBU2205579.1 hypothetical protein [Gammaproteobacteria bacterium]